MNNWRTTKFDQNIITKKIGRRYLSPNKLPNETRMYSVILILTYYEATQASVVAKQLVNGINEPLKSNFGKNSSSIKRRNERRKFLP